jgi:hypothetical protein
MTDRDRIGVRSADILTVEQNRPGNPRSFGEIVHPVERPQERRFAAARRPDQRA